MPIFTPTTFSTDKKKGGSYKLTALALTQLGELTEESSVSDVLDILSEVTRDSHVVGPNQIGFATSTLL